MVGIDTYIKYSYVYVLMVLLAKYLFKENVLDIEVYRVNTWLATWWESLCTPCTCDHMRSYGYSQNTYKASYSYIAIGISNDVIVYKHNHLAIESKTIHYQLIYILLNQQAVNTIQLRIHIGIQCVYITSPVRMILGCCWICTV